MKVFLYSFLTFLFVSACSEKKEQLIVELPALKASEIYNPEDVKKYIFQYGEQHQGIASSYREKAEAIKDKDLKKAIYFLKRSITLQPLAESYEKLIDLLSQNKNYSEAYEAYNVLVDKAYYRVDDKTIIDEYVFTVPTEKILTDYIVMSILANNAVDYYALYNTGEKEIDKQKIREVLMADKRFNYDSANIVHKNIIAQFWTDEEIEAYKKSLVNMHALLRSVKDTSAAFEINQKNVSKFMYDDFNGINYSEFDENLVLSDMFVYYLKEKQDYPNRWLQYNINHTFRPNPSLEALVYAVDTSVTACPIEMREIYHRLVIYGADGKIISDKVVACQSGEVLQAVTFNKDHFEIAEYKRTWRKPYNKRDFDNEVVKSELIAKKAYQITETGEITESAPAAVN